MLEAPTDQIVDDVNSSVQELGRTFDVIDIQRGIISLSAFPLLIFTHVHEITCLQMQMEPRSWVRRTCAPVIGQESFLSLTRIMIWVIQPNVKPALNLKVVFPAPSLLVDPR